MKPLKELRKHDLKLSSRDLWFSRVKDLPRRKLDFEVFLPTLGVNLQREKVWTLQQKRELIMSVFIERPIPHVSLISAIGDGDDLLLVIDGKQRLTTLLDFLAGGFDVEIEGQCLFFGDLPDDYRKAFEYHEIFCQMAYEQHDKRITDADKVEWFKRINFFGTPQELEHLKKLG